MEDDFKILLDAGLDDNAKQHLQNDLSNIEDLQATIQKLNLSDNAVAQLKQSLQRNGINLDASINIGAEQARQAQQAGQQIGRQINQGIQSIIQKGSFKTAFKIDGNHLQNNIAEEAKNYFAQLKQGAVSVKESMSVIDGKSLLDGFVVSIKKTDGVIEELKYSLQDLEGATGKIFQYTGGSVNDNGVIKQINATTNAISQYKQKVAQFKSTNESILSGIDFSRFDNAMQALENGVGSINAVKNAYANLGEQASTITKELSGQLSKAASAVRNIAKGDDTIAGLRAELQGLHNTPKEITAQLGELGTKLAEIKRIESEFGRNADWAKSYREWQEEASSLRSTLQRLKKEQANPSSDKILTNVDTGKYNTEIVQQTAQLQKYGYSVDEARNKVSDLTEQLRIMSSVDTTPAERVQAEAKFNTALETTKNTVAQLKAEWQSTATVQSRLTKANHIESFLQKNTRITQEARNTLQQYVVSLRDVETAMSRVEKSNIDVKFQEIQNSMRGLGKLGYALSDQFKQAASNFTQWLSVSSLVMAGVTNARQAVGELVEIDNILTEISKTSDMTEQELAQLGKTSFSTASELGRTATDYLNTVTEMSRSGFYGEQGEAMAKQVLLAQTAGDMEQQLASDYVISANAAYKLGGNIKELNKIISGQNLITNRHSVALTDMAEAMSIAGSVAAEYRVDPAELSAITGVIESVTKLGGSEDGNAIKALLINLQNITSSKIVDTLDKAGASMTTMVDGVEKLRKPTEILRDLATTFQTLDEDDPLRAEILTNVGGKTYHVIQKCITRMNLIAGKASIGQSYLLFT